jgi:hypothetical protein
MGSSRLEAGETGADEGRGEGSGNASEDKAGILKTRAGIDPRVSRIAEQTLSLY